MHTFDKVHRSDDPVAWSYLDFLILSPESLKIIDLFSLW